jgi:hypothetical protein
VSAAAWGKLRGIQIIACFMREVYSNCLRQLLVLGILEAARTLQQEQQGQPQSLEAAAKEQPAVWQRFECQALHAALRAFCAATKQLGNYLIKQTCQSAGQGTMPAAFNAVELLRSPELHLCFTLMTCVGLAAIKPSYRCHSSGRDQASGNLSSGRTSKPATAQPKVQSAAAAAAGPPEKLQAAAVGGRGTSCTAPDAADVGFGFPVSPLTSKLFDQLGVGHAVVAMQQATQLFAGAKQATARLSVEEKEALMPFKNVQFFKALTGAPSKELGEVATQHYCVLCKVRHTCILHASQLACISRTCHVQCTCSSDPRDNLANPGGGGMLPYVSGPHPMSCTAQS